MPISGADAQKSYYFNHFGPGRVLTAGAAATRSAVLRANGRYLFFVTGGSIHVRTGGSDVTADAVNDMRFDAGSSFYFVAGDIDDTGANGGDRYLSIIRDGGVNGTVVVCGVDEGTARAAPPAWA